MLINSEYTFSSYSFINATVFSTILLPVFSKVRVHFDIVDKKLKAIDADAVAKGGGKNS